MAKANPKSGSKARSKMNKEVAKEILNQVKAKIASDYRELEPIRKYYSIVEDHITPVIILHKVMETLEIYLKTVQQILQPEEFHALYECNAFDDDEKGELFELYKKSIIMHRELLKALIENDEKNTIATLKKVHEESLELKPKMISIVEKLQKSWKAEKSSSKSKSVHYFG